MEIKIRKINLKKDFDDIHKIVANAWVSVYKYRKLHMDQDIFSSIYADGPINKANQVRQWCIDNCDNVRVAEVSKNIVGFITWIKDSPARFHIELSNNGVHPEMQRKGVASSMYKWFLEYAKNEGFKYVNVFTGLDPAHNGARKIYKKMGFETPIEYVKYYKKL